MTPSTTDHDQPASSPTMSGIATAGDRHQAQEFEDYFATLRRYDLEAYFLSLRNIHQRQRQRDGVGFFTDSGLLRRNEVAWCSVLFWLLTDNGPDHQLPARLREIAFNVTGDNVKTKREEQSDDYRSRYDITMRSGDHLTVIEAKIGSQESEDQTKNYFNELKRTAKHLTCWYLTTDAQRPSDPRWKSITWMELAKHITVIIDQEKSENESGDLPNHSPGQQLWLHIAKDFCNHIDEELG